jgi:succinate dehydrogenase / fumarate reductase membrane anchor subunit
MSRQASGLKAWLIQRLSAVYLGLFLAYLLLHFTLNAPADHAALTAWVRTPLVAAGLLLFIPLLLAHAWIGVRDVVIDYVHALRIRLALLSLFAVCLLASGLWALKAIISAGLTA